MVWVTVNVLAAGSARAEENTTDQPVCATSNGFETCTWSTPGTYEWTVPDGVDSVEFDLYGAQGGHPQSNPSLGGRGGHTTATLGVSSAQPLQINVGGAGKWETRGLSGGYNGGGESAGDMGLGGGGGGGASDVRQGANTLDERFFVAGGGGGVTAEGGGVAGGDAGGPVGKAGAGTDTDGAESGNWDTRGGQGATQTEPGKGGLDVPGICVGGNGSVGKGGDAVVCDIFTGRTGGGGGGWYGGGGGATTCGGFVDENGAGGGGSGYIDPSAQNATSQVGVRSGDGAVTVRFRVK